MQKPNLINLYSTSASDICVIQKSHFYYFEMSTLYNDLCWPHGALGVEREDKNTTITDITVYNNDVTQ